MAVIGQNRWLAFAICAIALSSARVTAEAIAPFEYDGEFVSTNRIDAIVLNRLRARRIPPAYPCSDEVFIRRIFLDVIGTLPMQQEVVAFLKDARTDKRALLIDALMEREEFADYWSLKWCDLLRVKAEFPINLWPNAVQAYHRWIRDAVAENMPYDTFARELLTSSGSNFRVPQVNFYRAIQGQEPESIATAVALTFMGSRLDTWPEDQRDGMVAFFSRVGYKETAEWKEEIVHLDTAPTEPLRSTFPGGRTVTIPAGRDPRKVFAGWLTAPGNPWFARNIVNRTWSWLFGRGIIHEPDDIRADNRPVNPKLLAYLETELARAKYDWRHILRLILNSGTYQQSSIPRSDHKAAPVLFACYPVRRLDAEVLIDALCSLFGGYERYSSPIPEPFTFIPEEHRTIALADGSITSQFLEMFGRPARDTGLESERSNEPTDAQRLHFLNSTHVQKKIEASNRLKKLLNQARGKPEPMVRSLYLSILSRHPTEAELTVVKEHLGAQGVPLRQAATDLAWALINTKEFLYRH